jgi:hypothetical protein
MKTLFEDRFDVQAATREDERTQSALGSYAITSAAWDAEAIARTISLADAAVVAHVKQLKPVKISKLSRRASAYRWKTERKAARLEKLAAREDAEEFQDQTLGQ